MKTCKIDQSGLYIEDVIHPDTVLVAGEPDAEGNPTFREAPFPIPADEIATPVPDGFWHPKWNGSKWVEGLSATEIAARQPKTPNWEQVIVALSDNASPLKAEIKTTTDQLALMSLVTELHQPQPRFSILKLHWDNVIAGLPSPLSDAQKQGFLALAAAANLNLSLDASAKLIQIE